MGVTNVKRKLLLTKISMKHQDLQHKKVKGFVISYSSLHHEFTRTERDVI